MPKELIDLIETQKEKNTAIQKSVSVMCKTIKKDAADKNTNELEYFLSLPIISFDSIVNRKNDYFNIQEKCPAVPRNLLLALKKYIKFCGMGNNVPELMIQSVIANITQIMCENNLFFATNESLRLAHLIRAEALADEK